MINNKFFDEMSERLAQVTASGPAADLDKNLRAMMASLATRLNLVTREEFEVQREMLARTREKLSALESRVAELEQRLSK
jgi:ubiquinone biosynthesis accessory factor UbiK